MKIICVCTGNTCRSPMAAALLADALAARGRAANIRSAGLFAQEGAPASEYAIRAMAQRGLDISSHRAHALNEADAAGSLLVCMTKGHVAALSARFPGARPVLLTEFAGMSGDIPDPYAGSYTVYAACADALAATCEKIADLLREAEI